MKKWLTPAVVFLVSFSLLFAGCGAKSDGGYSYFVQLNIDRSSFCVDGDNLSAGEYRELMSELKNLLCGLEEDFSVVFDDSDISRINSAAAGESVCVSDDTYSALSLAFGYAQEEHNKFSPALFPLTQLWGFSPEFEGRYGVSREEPDQSSIESAMALSDSALFSLGENNTVTKSVEGAKLDLGGIAKGYMCDRICQFILDKYAGHTVEGIISVMSNMILLGKKHDSDGTIRDFNVAIDNPRNLVFDGDKSSALFLVGLSDVSVTTSADNYRFYVYEDKIYPHIIDGETGKPADRGIISVTAVVPNTVSNAGAFADSLTTAAFCMPLTDALSFFEAMYEKYGVGAVLITADRKYYVVGDINVLDRGDYAAFSNEFLGTDYDLSEFTDDEEVFFAGDLNSAEDVIIPCDKEKEYIEKVKNAAK